MTAIAANPDYQEIAVRMVDEGIPIRVIARSLFVDMDDLREVVDRAVTDGRLLAVTRDDWPPGTLRQNRLPDHSTQMTDEFLAAKCGRMFHLTSREALLLVALLRRTEASKEQLLQFIYAGADDAPEIKIIDVFICKVRKKLKDAGILIETMWGRGYFIPGDARRRVFDMIEAYDMQPVEGDGGGI